MKDAKSFPEATICYGEFQSHPDDSATTEEMTSGQVCKSLIWLGYQK